jgi:di/tricarboxylate transporter
MLLPQAIAVNFSYMLPAASSSNAVVFGTGYLTLKDMVIY